MGKIFLTIFLIFSIACSSSPDLMDTVIDKQKEMDAQYQQAQAGTKTKSTESPKASETTKPKKNRFTKGTTNANKNFPHQNNATYT